MKREEETIKGQADGGDPAGKLSYETSRRPKDRRKKIFAVSGAPLITPSGGRVPPGWAKVWMTNDPESPIQAIGEDSKGRRVYLYSDEYMGKAAAAKFARLRAFSQAYPSLIKQIRRDMKTSEEATVLYLIAKTGFRIGSNSETRAVIKAFGASTLRCSHVSVAGNRISFDFTGKKGIRVNKVIKDAFLAGHIAGRCYGLTDDKIFRTNDDEIRAYLNSISEDSQFTVKDFRTYMGTLTAFRKLKTMPIPRNVRETKSYRKEVGKTVARELGNSPAIALNSYVSPEVFCVWESNRSLVKKKVGGTRSTLTDEFLECIHYDREVPMENITDINDTEQLE